MIDDYVAYPSLKGLELKWLAMDTENRFDKNMSNDKARKKLNDLARERTGHEDEYERIRLRLQDMNLKETEREVNNQLESVREDRKDDRVDRQANHQKEMIEQRKTGDSLKIFESSGNDIVTGGAGIDRF